MNGMKYNRDSRQGQRKNSKFSRKDLGASGLNKKQLKAAAEELGTIEAECEALEEAAVALEARLAEAKVQVPKLKRSEMEKLAEMDAQAGMGGMEYM